MKHAVEMGSGAMIYIYIYTVPCWRYLLGFTDSATQFFTLFIPDFTVGITIALLRTQELSNSRRLPSLKAS
jgi:hypothetical protein